jgi:OTT_1508-like deaminase
MNSVEARSSNSEHLLVDLIKSIHSLVIEHQHEVSLVPYAPGLWSGNATESLMDRLGKLSHYVKACEHLLRAARRYSIFSNIAIEFVNLQQKGRRISETGLSNCDKLVENSCSEQMLSQVSIRQNISLAKVRELVKSRLSERSRVHAEIQLVLYYEENSILFRPRVICSSKSGCYLCHLFFKIHGRYFIPSTHGKLYDTWRWPVSTLSEQTKPDSQLDIQHILPQLSDSIDRKISQCLQRTRTINRVEVAESRVDLSAAMKPPTLSQISRHSETLQCEPACPQETVAIAMGIIDDGFEKSSTASPGTKKELSPVPKTLLPGVETPKQASEYNNEGFALGQATPRQCEVEHSLRGRAASRPQQLPLKLQAGDILTHSFDKNNTTLEIDVPGLHLDLQYDASSTGQNQLGGEELRNEETSFGIQVEHLHPLTDRQGFDPAQAFDLEEGDWLEKSAAEGILFSAEGLLLKKGSVVLRLRAQVK